jgi:serine/threonine protein kinase
VIYRLLELIGEGTFGKVYKGVNEMTREYIAVKIVNTGFTLGTQKKQTSLTVA